MATAIERLSMDDVDAIAVPELGNTCYLLVAGEDAVVIDAPRCTDALLELAERRGASISAVLDTHLHNDFLSGAIELRRRTGAALHLPAGGGYAFAHEGMREGSVLDLDGVQLVALETPGHTPEHLAYALERDGTPVAVFTGGSLLVGNAGRSDLLGPGRTEALERDQFRSLRRLFELPEEVAVLPTHGEGSFCVGLGTDGSSRTSTIGRERGRNPLARVESEDAFVASRGEETLPIPAYYATTAPRNRAGVEPVDTRERARGLTPDELAAEIARGAVVIDVRDRIAFCEAHVPGSLNVELDAAFVGRVGSIVPVDARVALVVSDPERVRDDAVVPLARIGVDDIAGSLHGVEGWVASGRSTGSIAPASLEELAARLERPDPPLVLDVRMPIEWAQLPLPLEATRVYVGELPEHVDELPRDREIWTICSAGGRSVLAASLLAARGYTVRPVAEGGALELLTTLGGDL